MTDVPIASDPVPAPAPRHLGLRAVLVIAALFEAAQGFENFYTTAQGTAQIIAFPLMAACGIACAARNRRLGIATALVSIPTFWFWLGVIAFAIGVSIYGF